MSILLSKSDTPSQFFVGVFFALLILLVIGILIQFSFIRLPEPIIWHTQELQNTINKMHQSNDDVDILLIGSSASLSAFDESIISAVTNCFNASFAGPSLRAISLILENVFLTKLAPRKVLIGLTPNELCLGSPQVKRTDKYFLNSLGMKAKTGSILQQITATLRIKIRMFSYSNNISNMLRGIPQANTAVIKQVNPYQVGPSGRDRLIYNRLKWLNRTDEGYVRLAQICKMLKRKNIVPIICLLPLSSALINTVGAENLAAYKFKTRTIASEYGAIIIDMDESLKMDQSDNFNDIIHYSAKGRFLISTCLKDELRKIE